MPNDSSSGFTLSRNTDPRTIITPDAFTVDESLFGTPLAAPWRRFVAICLDFVLAAFIANVGGALVGFVVAILFFRLATRRRVDKVLRRWLRTTLAFLGAFALFVTAVSVLGDDDEDDGGLPFFVSGVMSVEDDVPDPSAQGTQQTPADSVLTLLREHNVDVRTFQDAVGMPAVALDVLASETTLDDLSPDERAAAVTALRRYADALAAADEAALDTLQSEAVAVTAGDRLRALRERIDTMDDENDELEDTNEALREQLEEPSFAYLITGLGNDLGLTFGWIGIYFTLFLAWWKGQTPGKYLMGIRVVRLNGEPLSLWFAMERFGGYAAGVVTGFLGFLQIYWDPNRQGIHDRIARTVVIQTGAETQARGALPGSAATSWGADASEDAPASVDNGTDSATVDATR